MVHVELKNLSKKFGSFTAVDQINLSIRKGEFVSLLGGSGCGKTTTLRMVAGFEGPTEGQIFVDGTVINDTPAKLRNMGMVFQSYALFPTKTVSENIAFGLKVRKTKPDKIKKTVAKLLALAHMDDLAERYPAQLSGGQQQRVALLRALAIEPTVLLLDEPLSNLDAKLRITMRNEIKKIQSNLNITTIYVTHDQEEALVVSDKIAVMNQGRIHQIGSPIDIYTKPADRFVADFIGISNFLDCEVAGTDTIRCEDTLLKIQFRNVKKSGDKITLSFRPEHITLSKKGLEPSNPDGRLILTVTIAFEVFLGTNVRLEAITKGGQTILIDIPLELKRELDCKIGNQAILSVSSDYLNIF
jgi:ABC-type Fe3+/spermidine/putrescine transport system ATPase subunit